MKKIFVDTGARIALADKNDQYHLTAKQLFVAIQQKNLSLLITDYIFAETVTWLHYKIGHSVACEWGRKILNSRMVEMVKVDDEQLGQAWKIFQKE